MEPKLSAKQERFCQEYAIDQNATQAAIRAKYSQRTAKVQGSKLLSKANVKARVAELLAAAAKEAGITLEMVVDRLALFAFTDLDEVVDLSGTRPRIKGPLELDDPKKRGIITGVSETSTGLLKITTASPQAALETLKSILTGPSDINLNLSGEVIQKIERVIVDPKGAKAPPRET